MRMPHAPTLAEFGFALIPVRILCVASPTEMNFQVLASFVVRKVVQQAIKLPHVPTWHHSFPQHPTIEQHQRSARPSKIGGRISQQLKASW